ncbi:MAG: hydrogenase maturation protease [Thermoplasmatota archaeon]
MLKLPEYCTARVLVLGCGNPLVGDDGFGPAVAERLLSEMAGASAPGEADGRAQAAGAQGVCGGGDGRAPFARSGRPVPKNSSAPTPATPSVPAPPVCIINAGTGSRGIIFNLVAQDCRPEALIIVDALRTGRRPGELFWVNIEDLSLEKAEDFSLHMTPASNMLYRLKQLGVDIHILACEPRDLPEFISEGLSPEVEAAVGPAAEMVMAKARKLLGAGQQ